jgi:hypothetical protein
MGILQPISLYLAFVTLVTLRFIASGADSGAAPPLRGWARDAGIAGGVALLCNLVPARSPLMSVLMMLAYLLGFMVLTLWLNRRFGHLGGGSLAGRILVIMCCLVVAMVAMALPILLLAGMGLPALVYGPSAP